MMMTLLVAKEKVKVFYEKHYIVVKPLLKFLLSFAVFMAINSNIGYEEQISGVLVPIVLAFVCSFAPEQIMVYFALILAVLHIISISTVLGIALLVFSLAIFLLVIRSSKEQAFVILAVPLLTAFHVSYLVPLVMGVFLGPTIIPALVIGVVYRYIFIGIKEIFTTPTGSIDLEDSFSIFRYVVDYVLQNKEILLFIIGFILTYLATYLVRRRKVKYASQIGILVGAIVMLITFLLGNIILGAGIDVPLVVYGIMISVILAYIMQFFRMTLDYTGTKRLQFEDEEYYYYVKAVPKINVSVKEETVTFINPKQELEEMSSLQEEFEKVLEEETYHKGES